MCQEFSYGGCLGNDNRFHSLIDCQNGCKKSNSTEKKRSETCYQEKKAGKCLGYFEKYFFNNTANECQQFIYGNNFKNKKLVIKIIFKYIRWLWW